MADEPLHTLEKFNKADLLKIVYLTAVNMTAQRQLYSIYRQMQVTSDSERLEKLGYFNDLYKKRRSETSKEINDLLERNIESLKVINYSGVIESENMQEAFKDATIRISKYIEWKAEGNRPESKGSLKQQRHDDYVKQKYNPQNSMPPQYQIPSMNDDEDIF